MAEQGTILKTFENALNGQAYDSFALSIPNPKTLRLYRFGLCRYMMYRRVARPEELLIGDSKQHEGRFIEWLQSMVQEGLSYDSRYVYKAAVKHFYTMNDTVLNWKKISKFIGNRERKNKDRAWSYEEIEKMLAKADERIRVAILLMASTGMRVGALPGIRLRDLKRVGAMYQVAVYSGEREEYRTFCSPECAAAIDSYLDFRLRYDEQAGKDGRLLPNAPLIREMFDTRDPFQAKSPRFIADSTITAAIRQTAIRAGVRVPVTVGDHRKGAIRHEVAIDNGFRKFFDTKCHEARIDATIKQMLVGHTVGLENNYLRPTDQTFIDEYQKAIPYLTINRNAQQVVELTAELAKAAPKEAVSDLYLENKKLKDDVEVLKAWMNGKIKPDKDSQL